MALLTETNAQYYSGQQVFGFLSPGAVGLDITLTGWSFDTEPISAFSTPIIGATPTRSLTQVASVSNFEVYFAPAATPNTFTKINEDLVYVNNSHSNSITIIAPDTNVVSGTDYEGYYYIQLKQFAISNNYGNYSYITLDDIINNVLVAYVGPGKLISNVKRTDLMFHAKRGLQEFSYDVLKSIKSQELTIPPSLSVPIPQDYVNYVRTSWVDSYGVTHLIYPTRLTTNPYTLPIQDDEGIPTQDGYGENLEAEQSITEENWATANDRLINGNVNLNQWNANVFGWSWDKLAYGKRYGLNPETSNKNGWFTINEREGKFSFSSNLKSKLIVLEYISDGLSSDGDTKVPKMAEEAMYMHIIHAVLASRTNVPEYVINRYKRERSSTLRNAKIRLSNIKLEEFTQVMRGKSKWIKH